MSYGSLVIAATENDTLYGIDAADGTIACSIRTAFITRIGKDVCTSAPDCATPGSACGPRYPTTTEPGRPSLL